MKSVFNTVFFISFFLYMYVLFSEFMFALEFKKALPTRTLGVPVNSATYSMASHDSKWIKAETAGVNKRIKTLRYEIAISLVLFFIAFLFINKSLRNYTMKIADYHLNIIGDNIFNINVSEINFICLIATPIIILEMHGMLKKSLFDSILHSNIIAALFYIVMFTVFLPLLLVLIFSLFKTYGVKIILACYLAFFIKAFAEFATQEEVDLSEMRKVPIDGFSKTVQKFLTERKLDDKVYQEISKSDSINAALVGWGSHEHIEIYGNHSNFTDEEFESILLHEIGHSKNQSLLKKIFVLFVLKLLEMMIVVVLYTVIADKYSDATISQVGAFVILYILYLAFLNKWLMIFHKLTSQMAEIDSDLVAKDLKYGGPLSKVLYKISVGASDYLYSTTLYNALKSYHPTVFFRIEYLNKKR